MPTLSAPPAEAYRAGRREERGHVKDGSRGWKRDAPEAAPFFEKCIELGVTNVHVHKGPTTYPLDAINDAMADLDGGRLQGRGILVPA